MKPYRTMRFFFIFSLIAALLISGCASGKRTLKSTGRLSDTDVSLGLSVGLRYLNEEELSRRFGTKNNPYKAPSNILSHNQFIVFEVTFDGERNFRGPYTARVKDMEIQFGGVNKCPKNRFQLTNFWKGVLKPYIEDKKYTGWSIGKVQSVIKKTMVPDEAAIRGGDHIRGIVVFEGAFPRYGDAVVYIPVLKEGSLAKNYRFDLEFGYEE